MVPNLFGRGRPHAFDSATIAWKKALAYTMNHGEVVKPRGQKTMEMLGLSATFDMNYPVIQSPARKLGGKFMAAEAAWILSGDNRVSTIAPFSKEISRFSDDGETFFGAYGPRVVDQVHHVTKSLSKDPDSRQAVIDIWRPNPPETKDVPCTIAVQWFIRDGKLHCVDMMRSSDLWLGWPYDVFNFTMLSGAIAIRLRKLGVTVHLGNLTLFAGSQHIYERNFDAVHEVLQEEVFDELGPRFDPNSYESVDHLTYSLWQMATHGDLPHSFNSYYKA